MQKEILHNLSGASLDFSILQAESSMVAAWWGDVG